MNKYVFKGGTNLTFLTGFVKRIPSVKTKVTKVGKRVHALGLAPAEMKQKFNLK